MHLNSSKRKSNEYFNLSVTLFTITTIVAVLLSMVNFVTSNKIAIMKQEKLKQAMITVLPEATAFEDVIESVKPEWNEKTGLLGVQKAKNEEGQTIGFCVEVAPNGYSDIIDMMVGINQNGEVTNVSIISLSDTPGIGTQIEEELFQKQFVGKSGTLTAVKGSAASSTEVALISGATYSSTGFADGVNAALQVYKILTEEGTK